MRKIASFCVNHLTLGKGMYISRVDGDIVTYDIRMKVPNAGDYLENAPLHTFEHLFATYARNSALSGSVVYVGPMGCRTGFYLLMRGVSHAEALALTRESMDFIAAYEGEVPGVSARECGNWLDHDLQKARAYAADMARVLKDCDEARMTYPD